MVFHPAAERPRDGCRLSVRATEVACEARKDARDSSVPVSAFEREQPAFEARKGQGINAPRRLEREE